MRDLPEALNCPEELEVIYLDDRLVAINKPAGLLVHRSPIDRHETRFALQWLRDQIGQRVYPVHRLDKPTSGLLLFALDQDAAAHVSMQFERGYTNKRYLALVRGHAPAHLAIDHPLRDEVDSHGNRITDGMSRDARTDARCQRQWVVPLPVDRYPEGRYSLLELSPHTGRFRQLRRHMKHIAHPIIGDTRYGKGTHNRFFRAHFGCHRLMLASVALTISHPDNHRPLALYAPPSADFQAVIDQLDVGVGTHAVERSED